VRSTPLEPGFTAKGAASDCPCPTGASCAAIAEHDALPCGLSQTGWQRTLAEVEAVPFSCIDLSELPAAEQETALEATAAELQASLNLAEGPLRVAVGSGDNQPNRLLLVIHHLAVDGVSWRILLEDLQQAYQQLSQRGSPAAFEDNFLQAMV